MEHVNTIRLYSDKIERLKINWKPKKEKGIHSELHQVVKEAIDFFHEPKKFGMYLGFIKRIGIQEARKRIAEQKETNIKEPKFFFKKEVK